MDHLNFEKFHVLGGCIGGSFCLKAVETAPHRVMSAVLQNPIGLHPEHPEYFPNSHAEWTREQLAARPDLNAEALAAFGRNMWDHPFVFCVDSTFVRNCPVPTFLLPGTDIPHPAATSAQLAALLPGVEVLTDWRGPDYLRAAGDPGGGISQAAHAVGRLTRSGALASGVLKRRRPFSTGDRQMRSIRGRSLPVAQVGALALGAVALGAFAIGA